PSFRAEQVAAVGGRLWRAGEKKQATPLLREAEAIAKTLPLAAWDGHARAAVARELVHLDVEGAVALVKGLSEEHVRSECFGRMACNVAAENPAGAGRLLERLGQAYSRGPYAARAATRMAAADPERAKALAAAIARPRDKAEALAGIA